MPRALAVLAVLAALFVGVPSASAVPGPDSVAVLANASVPGSVALAARYASERAIPDRQVCSLAMPATEDVTLAEFEAQISLALVALVATRRRRTSRRAAVSSGERT